ncbi:MAG TPA: hypothetical protein VEF35_02605 [Candidatus Bathyarchaeia archaeon]|nr:hypothetical protein [Candidatus Bathyarchaeia archaeon]
MGVMRLRCARSQSRYATIRVSNDLALFIGSTRRTATSSGIFSGSSVRPKRVGDVLFRFVIEIHV